MGMETEGCGASGSVSGGLCCCPRSSGRPSRMVANRKAPLRTLLVILNLLRCREPNARLFEAKLLQNRDPAHNVGQELQDQVTARVGGNRCREGKADNFAGDAGFRIIGYD
jgi:hypothetical protein